MLRPHKASGLVTSLRSAGVAAKVPDQALEQPKQPTAWSDASSGSASTAGVPGPGDDATFMDGLRLAATLAQVFGLLPVAKPTHAEEAAFRWRSLRVAYALAIIAGTVVSSGFAILRMVDTGVNFYTSLNVIFYTTSTATSVVFLRMGRTWKETFCFWGRLERHMVVYNGSPGRLQFGMRTLTAIVLVLAFFEHMLSIASALAAQWPCYDRGGLALLVESYFILKYRKTFTTIRYSAVRGALLLALQIITTFIWNFSDLFVMLVSMGLVAHFRQLNRVLFSSKGKIQHKEYWQEKRQAFNALAVLTRTMNDYLGPLILISYASNLYFICLQLLVLTKRSPQSSALHDLYFIFSFFYLIIRTCLMSLVAANICQESVRPKEILFSVPSSSFCREAQRFLMQVNTDSVALSGCNFFSITRSFMLTVAGTIVTYIVILVQFDNKPSDELGGGTNTSIACTCSDLQIYDC